MTDTKQIDLDGEPLPAVQRDVESEIEIIEYELFISEKWKLKARKDAIETIFEDNTDPDKLAKALKSFVQQRIRVKNKDVEILPGDFDMGVDQMIGAIRGA